jgi:outer membrane protein assembly factor BamB/predicted phosphodiesterase
MKKIICVFVLVISLAGYGQPKTFRFAFLSDTHIGSPNGGAEEDLRRTVRDINAMTDVAFVVLTGDITELGTNEELKLAKKILDSLDIPYYIIPGNHDTGWSESGGAMFATVFGYDKFSFEYNGIRFLGCPSGPYVRMSDGHVPRDAVNWLDAELKKLKPKQPVIFLNHYPIDNGLDNWYEVTDQLRKYNTLAILCGHGHSNKAMNFEEIPGVMGRSNLRAKAPVGGYNLVDMRSDSMLFTERKPGVGIVSTWTGVKIENHQYDAGKKFPRPDYSSPEKKPELASTWTYSSDANIISTPAVADNSVIVGNQNGEIVSFSLDNGKKQWSYKTGGAIFSSPAIAGKKVILGSADGCIYCLDTKNGKLLWKKTTGAAVLGAPLINGDTVFIGGSDHHYLALNTNNGNTIWQYDGLDGPVVSRAILYDGKLIFGAWDRHLYAVSSATGEFIWKWNNGSSVRNYSPASCIPVVNNGVIYIVAPDRFITAIDATSGIALWRNNDGGVRESIGISADGKWIYAKSMQDTIVTYAASREKQAAAWKMSCGFGYEHVPSMLIEKEGLVFFGTKNGVVYCINPATREIVWKYKIDNSMVNTVNVIDKRTVVATTMDGKIAMLKVKEN